MKITRQENQDFFFIIGDDPSDENLRAELWAPDGFCGLLVIDESKRTLRMRLPTIGDNKSSDCDLAGFQRMLNAASEKLIKMHPEIFG